MDKCASCERVEKEGAISNFILYFTSDEKEREDMYKTLKDYMEAEAN